MISTILLVNIIRGLSLIVPMNHLNHRLTYNNGIKFINSSVNDVTRVDDYFNFPDQYTFLSNQDKSLCKKDGGEIFICPKSDSSVVWKIDTEKRFARFRDAEGNCLTLGKHDKAFDTYEAMLKECVKDDQNQIFHISLDHGDAFNDIGNQNNAYKMTDDERIKIKEGNKLFSTN